MENVDLCFGQTCYLVFVLLPCRPLVILVSDLRVRQIKTAMGFILGALDNIWGVKLKWKYYFGFYIFRVINSLLNWFIHFDSSPFSHYHFQFVVNLVPIINSLIEINCKSKITRINILIILRWMCKRKRKETFFFFLGEDRNKKLIYYYSLNLC